MAGVGKYGRKGLMRKEVFKGLQIPEEVKEALADLGNHGLSKSTWSNYRTAERMLLKCQKDRKRCMELPLGQEEVLIFVDWLVRDRKVKHGTVTSYLAGVRQAHVSRGMGVPVIRTDLVNLILAGKKNVERMGNLRRESRTRLPVTLGVMKLLKATLREAEMNLQEKLLTWTVACIAFNGSFRIHELLAKEEKKFDPIFTLLEEDLGITAGEGGGVILVNVKWPKEEKNGREFTVEVFETGGPNCPVKALKKWWARDPPRQKGLPAFRKEDGTALTGRALNLTLKKLLGEHLDYGQGTVTTHSFRSGIPTLLGAAGFSDEDIMAVGRWSSRAFEQYVKLGRTKRREMAKAVAEMGK